MKIVVTKNNRGKWYWKIVGTNGRILAHSEDYSRKGKCVKTALKVLEASFQVEEGK